MDRILKNDICKMCFNLLQVLSMFQFLVGSFRRARQSQLLRGGEMATIANSETSGWRICKEKRRPQDPEDSGRPQPTCCRLIQRSLVNLVEPKQQ